MKVMQGLPSDETRRRTMDEAKESLGLRSGETIADLEGGRVQVRWMLVDTCPDGIDNFPDELGEACPRVLDLQMVVTPIPNDREKFDLATYNRWSYEVFLLLEHPDPRLGMLEYDFREKRWRNPHDKGVREQRYYTITRLPAPAMRK